MGDKHFDQVQTIVNFCLEELTSSAEVYDKHHRILHSASAECDEQIIAFGRMNEASKRHLAAWDRLAQLGYYSIYDHEHKRYIAKQQ